MGCDIRLNDGAYKSNYIYNSHEPSISGFKNIYTMHCTLYSVHSGLKCIDLYSAASVGRHFSSRLLDDATLSKDEAVLCVTPTAYK